MYPRSKFQEVLLVIREEMAREADFDVDLFAEIVRSGLERTGQKRFAVSESDDKKNGLDHSRRSSTPKNAR